jgi:hypothetical protein
MNRLLNIINKKNIAAVVVMVFVFLFGGGGEVKGQTLTTQYKFTSSVGTYTAITGGTVHYAGAAVGTNGVTAAITIPSFNFNGTAYTSIIISNNGFITFGATAPASTLYSPLSNATAFGGVVAGYAVNLIASTSATGGTAAPEIRSQLVGSEFIIQYKDVARTGIAADKMNFQIRLNTSTNEIKIVYGTCVTTSTNITTIGQVGLRGASTNDHFARSINGTAPYNTWASSGGTNSAGTTLAAVASCYYRTATLPVTGLTYSYTRNSSFATLPFNQNFESAPWGTRNSLQDAANITYMSTFPQLGNQAWKRQNETAVNSLWTNTGGALAALTASQGTGVARFQSYIATLGYKGYMDFYVNFSTAGTKTLTFDYQNTSGTDALKVYLSVDGGLTFGAALTTLGVSTTWATQSATLGTSIATNCVVRFEGTSDYGSDCIGVDNVNISVPVVCTTPTSYTVTGGGSYCSGGSGVAIGLNGSQSSVSYQLYNGASTVGSAVSGTGSSISFGNQTTAGTYTIVATGSGSFCTSPITMTGSASIIINYVPSQPSAIAGSTTPDIGSSQTYSVTNVAGVTYAWAFPSGWTQTGGGTTNSVTVTVGNTNGNITCTPSNACGSGTAQTLAIAIPAYRSKFTAMSLGSSTWCAGETRNITVTVMNNGTATWTNSTPDVNIGVKWNSDGTNWTDYWVRTDAGNLAPGNSNTYTFSLTASNSISASTYTTTLSAGSNNITFDIVKEGDCWFGNNNNSCGLGNSVYSSVAQTIDACEKKVPSTGSNSYTTCGGNLYDHAGSAGQYSYSVDGYTVLYPSSVGDMMRVSGVSSAGESCCDYVQVYNGVGLGGTLLGQYPMGTVVPTLTSTDASGALTVRFYSDVSVVGDGFNLALSCYTPPVCETCPNYNFGIYTPTTTPSTHSSSTSTGAGCKWYAFNVTSGLEYVFSTCSNGGTYSGDSKMWLKDNSCNAITDVDDYCSTGPQITWTATYTGIVYLEIAHYSFSNAVSWTLAYWQTSPLGENCSNAQNLAALTSPYSGTTVGYADDISICSTGYPDRIFYIEVPNGYSIDIWESANSYDEYEYMGYGASCPGNTTINCWDNDALLHNTWTNNTGSTQTVWYVQDGYSGSGTFTLNWTIIPSAPTTTSNSRCGNGSVTLSASGAVVGEVYKWYSAATGGTLLYTSSSYTDNTYTTASISATTNYYVHDVLEFATKS